DGGPDVSIIHAVGVGDLVGHIRAGQGGGAAGGGEIVVKDRPGSARDRRGDRPGFEPLQPQPGARPRRRRFPPVRPVRFADREGPALVQKVPLHGSLPLSGAGGGYLGRSTSQTNCVPWLSNQVVSVPNPTKPPTAN